MVTGSTGMVGRNFLEDGRSFRYEMFHPSSAELDLLSRDAVRRYIARVHPDLIIHCAGRVGGIQANIQNPTAFLIDNFEMGKNIVMAAAEVGVRGLINLASSCVYPKDHTDLLVEDDILSGPLEPTNEGYAIAKIAVMRLCQYICRQSPTLQYKTFIPCNLYGPYDKFDPNTSHLIPAILRKTYEAKIRRSGAVEIWGDGEARREFMYVGDLVDALYCAIDRLQSLPETVNVGLGYDHSVNEYYRLAAEVVGFTGVFIHDLSKPVGMRRKCTSVERMSQWGWKASVDLRTGLEHTYSYFKNTIGAGNDVFAG